MGAGQAGEAMVVVVVPVTGEQNTDTDPVIVLHHRTTDVHAVDLLPSIHHSIHRRVRLVLQFSFLDYIYIYIYILIYVFVERIQLL